MPGTLAPPADNFFAAIQNGESSTVRELLASDKDLTTQKLRGDFKYPKEMDLDALKFLGGYIGSVTGLHLAILQGQDAIARDILDVTFKENVDETFGGNNTALHLAAFLGAQDIVKLLLERGADRYPKYSLTRTLKNIKGFSPVDIADDDEMQKLFSLTMTE